MALPVDDRCPSDTRSCSCKHGGRPTGVSRKKIFLHTGYSVCMQEELLMIVMMSAVSAFSMMMSAGSSLFSMVVSASLTILVMVMITGGIRVITEASL